MFRFDSSSTAVLVMAVASSLSAAWWLNHLDDSGQAHAAAPPVAAVSAAGPAQLLKAADGHYWAEAQVDGRAVRLMVDTGASVVVLTRADADRLSVAPDPTAFTAQVQTAAGVVRAAPVRLASVSVAGVRVADVEALVVEDGLPHSLLGMSFLGRLSAFEATPASLTLKP